MVEKMGNSSQRRKNEKLGNLDFENFQNSRVQMPDTISSHIHICLCSCVSILKQQKRKAQSRGA